MVQPRGGFSASSSSMRLLFLWGLAIGSLVAGAPSRRANYVVHERRAVEPINLVKTRRVEPHRNLTIRIGLAQQNLHQLEEELMSVAQPDSQKYGRHWSPKRVAEYFAPSETTISTVKSWLIDAGLNPDQLQLSYSKGWISAKLHVSEVESLLKAEYHVYKHTTSGREIFGPCRISLRAIHICRV
jgi:tripeptidyl-peptidase-1